MRVIRLGVFETNSSSTHTMTILSEDEFKQWKDGDLFKYKWKEEFVSKEDSEKLIKQLKEDYSKKYNVDIEDIDLYELSDEYEEEIMLTFDQYNDWKDLEYDINRYTTKSGEEIVIICWYGNDY